MKPDLKSTQAMRDRCRELSNAERDDYDRAVICIIDDLEAILMEGKHCGECHLPPGEHCDICGKTAAPSTVLSSDWRPLPSRASRLSGAEVLLWQKASLIG
ncbi:hypothetical protein GWE18_00485 [Bradyrhizobium sp. CSA112]|uniref:hypothetical protein n=1 Tax=Bradyrhizobium sp. CSA112 TaxID=2699170 RepID=UPI0023B052C6|nr:hypothetical protein [Bradyrhizobium sp. CSA112]MDE5451353.1 hypothetical protein [Bradyrhizobium sp. CSA112]